MINLKPCCGGQPTIRKTLRFPKWKQGAVEACEAVCLNYECLIYNANEQYFDSEKSAAQAWNKRSSGWISVKDRLPEKQGLYLCYWEYHHTDFRVFDGEKFIHGRSDKAITHWMHLPEPPEVNEE